MTVHGWVFFSLMLFALGLYAVLSRRNLIAILIGIELMLNAASINFIAFNRFVADDAAIGRIIVLFIIGLAAAEVAIALSIVLNVYRQRHEIDAEALDELKG